MPSSAACHVDKVLKAIGDHWTLSLIHELSVGPRRTLELLAAFTGLSTKTLADRLKNLEREEIVRRVSYKETPPRVEYSLTEKGRALLPVLRQVGLFALRWYPEEGRGGRVDCQACVLAEADSAGQAPGRIKPHKKRDVTLL